MFVSPPAKAPVTASIIDFVTAIERSGMDRSERVRVAVKIRPLIAFELQVGCTDCISVVPGEPQVQIGTHTFTYDYVYGSTTPPSSSMYDDCVAPLVDELFRGYNATVLAYGQTGSGKTYTMGTNYSGEGSTGGIIPKVMQTIFKRVEAMKDNTEFLIRISFIEVYMEQVFDLLEPKARVPIQIRDSVSGDTRPISSIDNSHQTMVVIKTIV